MGYKNDVTLIVKVSLSITVSPKDGRVNKCKKWTAQKNNPRVHTLKIVFKSNATELDLTSKYVQVCWNTNGNYSTHGGSETSKPF